MNITQEEHEYKARRTDIENLISELQEALTLKDSVFKQKADWEHVDDLNNVREYLSKAVKYAKQSLDKW